MTLTTLGRVNQTAPGTPVVLATDPTKRVNKLYFQVVPGNAGKGYIGVSGMNKSTLAGVARVLAPNASGGVLDSFLIETDDAQDAIYLSQYAFDMDNAGEGLLISYWAE